MPPLCCTILRGVAFGPRAARWVEQHGGVEKFLEAEGGFDLWQAQEVATAP